MSAKSTIQRLHFSSHMRIFLPLVLILVPFILTTLPLCLHNITYLNLLSSFHIDSGSIIDSIFTMLTKGNYYNQNAGWHTRYYGYPYNSLLFFCFALIKLIFHIGTTTHFYIFALSARIISLLISTCVLITVYFFSLKLTKHLLVAFLITSLVAINTDFVYYSTLIKPDILALLFSLGCLTFLYEYLVSKNLTKFMIGGLLGGLAVFTKQQYIFILVPIYISYFVKKSVWKNFSFKKIKTIGRPLFRLFVITSLSFFLINPYSFIQISTFIQNQRYMLQMTASPINENLLFWFRAYLSHPLIICGLFLVLIYIPYYFIAHKSKSVIHHFIFLISTYCLMYLAWLSVYVGPIRVTAYLLPVYPYLLIVSMFLMEEVCIKIYEFNNKYISLSLNILILFSSIYLLVWDSSMRLNEINKLVLFSSNFSKTAQVSATMAFVNNPPKSLSNSKIIYTPSLPVPSFKFKDVKNVWQFDSGDKFRKNIILYKPNFIFIDFSQSYEKSFNEWSKVAHSVGLYKAKYYTSNTQKLVLFY